VPWKRQPRMTLPRKECGVDYGTARDVVLKKGDVMVVKTRGCMSWSGIGCKRSWASPQWTLIVGSGPRGRETLDLNDGYAEGGNKVTAEMWRGYLPKIAKAMGLIVERMPQKPPRGCTMVWDD